MFNMTTDIKDELMIVPIYGCSSSSYQTFDFGQLTFFKSDDAFAQTDQSEKMPTNPTDSEIISWYCHKSK